MPPVCVCVCVCVVARRLAAGTPQAARAWVQAQFSPAGQGNKSAGGQLRWYHNSSYRQPGIPEPTALPHSCLPAPRATSRPLTRKHGVLGDGAHGLGGAGDEVAHAARSTRGVAGSAGVSRREQVEAGGVQQARVSGSAQVSSAAGAQRHTQVSVRRQATPALLTSRAPSSARPQTPASRQGASRRG